jgi:hypothetical protein
MLSLPEDQVSIRRGAGLDRAAWARFGAAMCHMAPSFAFSTEVGSRAATRPVWPSTGAWLESGWGPPRVPDSQAPVYHMVRAKLDMPEEACYTQH